MVENGKHGRGAWDYLQNTDLSATLVFVGGAAAVS
jgi:hypothetical protein